MQVFARLHQRSKEMGDRVSWRMKLLETERRSQMERVLQAIGLLRDRTPASSSSQTPICMPATLPCYCYICAHSHSSVSVWWWVAFAKSIGPTTSPMTPGSSMSLSSSMSQSSLARPPSPGAVHRRPSTPDMSTRYLPRPFPGVGDRLRLRPGVCMYVRSCRVGIRGTRRSRRNMW